MKQKKIFIDGMHCKACTLRVQKALTDISGISKATVSHRHWSAIVSYEWEFNKDKVEKALSNMWYTLAHDPIILRWVSVDRDVWMHFFLSMLIVVVLYILFRNTNILDESMQYSGFGGMLILWLIAWVSTCMAVVGGVLLTATTRRSQTAYTSRWKWEPQLWFHAGRLSWFFFLGGLLWLLWSVFQLQWWGYVIIFALVWYIMLMQGIRLTELSPKIARYSLWYPIWLHRFFVSVFGRSSKQAEATTLGLGTFFLPCGFTLVAQGLAIASGNFWVAAWIMFGFALGTLPWLLWLGWLTTFLEWMRGKIVFRFLGVVLVVFGFYNFIWAWNTFQGVLSTWSLSQTSILYPITQEQDIFIVQDASGYYPNRIRVPVGTKINLHIDSQNQYSCASTISIPAAWIQSILLPGENVFEVLADRVGTIPFGCTMGMMYRGEIIVEE